MERNRIVVRGALDALGAALYIALVALFMTNISRFVGPMQGNGFFGPLLFLLLFVFSAAVTGGLILGKPVLLYLEGKKKEAVGLFLWTLAFLFMLLLIALLALLLAPPIPQ